MVDRSAGAGAGAGAEHAAIALYGHKFTIFDDVSCLLL